MLEDGTETEFWILNNEKNVLRKERFNLRYLMMTTAIICFFLIVIYHIGM